MPAPATATVPAPYRVLFPLGFVFAIAGAAPWILYAAGTPGYPGPLHRALMIQGFELSFVLGFLLTAIPAFTHGERCTGWELAGAVGGQILFGALAFAGLEAASHAVFVITLLWLATAAARRVRGAKLAPPEEFLFVAVGLALGLIGGAMQAGAALGLWLEPVPRFGIRLVSLGMMLALVLGVGSMLVPVFAGLRDPLLLPGVASAHERPGRRRLYVSLCSLLVLSFIADATLPPPAGEVVRLLFAATLALLGWKIWRLPGRTTLAAWALWVAGWMVLAGLVLAIVFPLNAVAFHHVIFIGGYGLLTLAIATRVVTGHGRHPLTDESRLVTLPVVLFIGLAVALRVLAEFVPPTPHWLAASSVAWIAALLLWGAAALPRIVRLAPPPPAGPMMVQLAVKPPPNRAEAG